jgi:hypothetical protein
MGSVLSSNYGPDMKDSEIDCSRFPSFTTCNIQSDVSKFNDPCELPQASSTPFHKSPTMIVVMVVCCSILVLVACMVVGIAIIKWRRKKQAQKAADYQMFDKVGYEDGYDDAEK